MARQAIGTQTELSKGMRIGALIPVRLASARLPGKALFPLCGRPVITHVLDRLFASRCLEPSRVVVCTTGEAADDPLIAVTRGTGAAVFRGSANIIDRLYKAALEFRLDAFIEADGDGPCVDPAYMDLCMGRLLSDELAGVAVAEGLPRGVAPKAVRMSALDVAWRLHSSDRNDNRFITYFTDNRLCRKVSVYPMSPSHQHHGARLTLEYPEDMTFLRAIFNELYREGHVFGVKDIVSLLRRRPELLTINADHNELFGQRRRRLRPASV